MIFNRLVRLETKIDHLSINDSETNQAPKTSSTTSVQHQDVTQNSSHGEVFGPQSPFPPTLSGTESSYGDMKLSFSTRLTPIYSLGLQPTQSRDALPAGSFPSSHGVDHIEPSLSDFELDGPAFAEPIESQPFPNDWLATLSLSTVKGLSNAYFNTFNRIFPFIDRDNYFLDNLSTVVRGGFGDDIESCLVLSVMALGCLGAKAYEEGGYHNGDPLPSTDVIKKLMAQDVPGRSLFNESRRRIGLCSSVKDIQVSQYYLTAALFYSQAMRPVDQWMMTDRASTNCLIFWTHLQNSANPWTCDMQSRVFWSALLMESVIAQELELPSSRLKEIEDIVPLPKFIAYPQAKPQSLQSDDESYYNYHFLAQIAHRIILIRIRDEIYYVQPSATVANELRYQLDLWHTNLPPALKSDDKRTTFSCPAEAYAMSLLQTRHRSAIYHLGRPFLYKAMVNLSSVTDQEMNFCLEALRTSSNWPIATGVCKNMKSFSPLKYFVCRSFFGTLSILHALKQSNDDRLVGILPEWLDAECSYMLQYIDDLAPLSPSIQKDRQVLTRLYGATDH
jgi:hypothetical protein